MGSGVIALLGSGETAPGMTKVHRDLLARLDAVRAVNLDSAYGFQQNVPQMTEKLLEYFATSLDTDLEPLALPSFAEATEVQRAIFKQGVAQATYVFAGPGSPSWALAQWRPLNLADDLEHVLAQDGVVCFASAAALTLGVATAPVYEIYKVGVPEPYWLEGLDLMGRVGLDCAVIPHFDNREGKNYDTRYCYLGEHRLRALESQLREEVAVLGIDEHTAVLIDLASDTLSVRGRGGAYWRRGGESRELSAGSRVPLEELRSAGAPAPRVSAPTAAPPRDDDVAGLAHRASEGGPEALEALARLARLAESGGEGRIDPSSLIDAVLRARAHARELGLYDLADELRVAITDAGVAVADGPDGSTWSLP